MSLHLLERVSVRGTPAAEPSGCAGRRHRCAARAALVGTPVPQESTSASGATVAVLAAWQAGTAVAEAPTRCGPHGPEVGCRVDEDLRRPGTGARHRDAVHAEAEPSVCQVPGRS